MQILFPNQACLKGVLPSLIRTAFVLVRLSDPPVGARTVPRACTVRFPCVVEPPFKNGVLFDKGFPDYTKSLQFVFGGFESF